MKRRDVIAALGGLAAIPLAARAQQVVPLVGFLNPTSPSGYPSAIAAFRQGLSEGGYIDGQSVKIEYRWAEGRNELLPSLAAELVARGVNVIAATGGEASAFAAKTATKTIPIVFNSGGDPVRTGLVDSLSRPSGNMTGVSRINTELLPKRLELISEVAPAGRAIAILMNPTTRGHDVRVGEIQSAARLIGREVTVLRASSEPEIDAAFTALMEARAGALLVTNDAFFNSRSAYLGGLAARHAVPAIYQNREFADAGGLMSYGPSLAAAYRVVGEYAGRILKGAKPADLPVQQQTKVDFFINLRTARLLGLTIPLPVVSLANEVIE